MSERVHFAALLFAAHMGLVGKDDLIARADQRIAELEKPALWLIDLSADGDSSELEHLIEAADDAVYPETLGLAYRAWQEGKILDNKFAACCQTLWKQAGWQSRWYSDLISVDAEFDLLEQGITRRRDALTRVKDRIERILRR